MNITDIRIRKIITEGRLRAVVSITIDNMLAIHDIKVIEGSERLFVAMPSRKEENGSFRDIVHPISPEARTVIENAILDAYNAHLASLPEEPASPPAQAAAEELAAEESVAEEPPAEEVL
ncbi:MAG: septation regulator SpoVG [Oscillospiraceae bacterium]|nr:septation regulator SpoVG [Oscillospiraceae bacterium]